ncbi:uncharacterized protein METZ01_LOCUS22808, partial [marine metagenome]
VIEKPIAIYVVGGFDKGWERGLGESN